VSGLETAGKAAAGVVGQAFHDGLKDSTKDKIVAGLIKFLKILVKVLTYLAMALAVIALLIPGLAPLILAIGIAMAAVTAVADLALAATHNGSWADFGIALAGLLTFGAGKLFGPAIEKLIAPLKNTIKTSITKAIGSARGILRAQPADVDVAVDDGVVLGSHVPGGNDVPIGDAASFGDSATVGYEVSFGDAASVGDAGSIGDDAWADGGDWADGGATAGDGLWGGDGASIGDDVSVGSMTPRVDDWPPQIGEGVLRRPVRDLDHANALYDYTYDGDGRVNPALRGTGQAWADAVGGGSAGAHVAELFTHMEEVVGMEEARAALPAFVGRTYRGVRSLPDALRLRLRPGDVFSDDGFFSTSRDLEPATEYAGEGGGGYLFTVDGVSGRDISAFSEFGLETEVLFGPSTRFSVIDVVHRPGGVTQVHLQER
jgi:acetyltransferase-like isoleucine patch superfamily enzyme